MELTRGPLGAVQERHGAWSPTTNPSAEGAPPPGGPRGGPPPGGGGGGRAAGGASGWARPGGGVGGPPARHAIGQRGCSTIAAVMRRTTGSTSNSAGKATTQDSAQALSHRRGRASENPATRTVLIRDTMKVMSSDSSSGMTQAAERAGNLRSPRKVWRDDGGSEEGWFIEIPESRPVKQGAAPTLQQMQARDHNPGRAGVGWHVDGRKNVFAIFSGPRWGAIGMSGCFGCAAWAHAHASSRGIQSPDFAPTLRASALPGGLRRCGACG